MPEIKQFVRFAHEGSTAYGLLIKDSVNELRGPPFQAIEPTGRSFPLSEVCLLTPCEPSKVLAVGLNYASHRRHVEKEEGVFVTVTGRPAPSDRPVVFAKFPTSLIGPIGPAIVTAGQTQQVGKGDVIEIDIEHVGTLRNRVAG